MRLYFKYTTNYTNKQVTLTLNPSVVEGEEGAGVLCSYRTTERKAENSWSVPDAPLRNLVLESREVKDSCIQAQQCLPSYQTTRRPVPQGASGDRNRNG